MCISAAFTDGIFVKFDVGKFHEKSVEKNYNFGYKMVFYMKTEDSLIFADDIKSTKSAFFECCQDRLGGSASMDALPANRT